MPLKIVEKVTKKRKEREKKEHTQIKKKTFKSPGRTFNLIKLTFNRNNELKP